MLIQNRNTTKKSSILLKKMKDNKSILLLTISAFFIRAFYIIYTTIDLRQHDVGSYQGGYGHLGYIAYLATHRLRLPDADPRIIEQFYHPPLHHMIAAIWVKLNMKLGFSDAQSYENIQILTLFYCMIILYFLYQILELLKFDQKNKIFLFSLFCFHPYTILLSGSINNDLLCILLLTALIYYAIQWYRKKTYLLIIKIATLLGFSMLSKASGVLIAPALAILFLISLLKNKNQFWKLFKQYMMFGIISIPLGMSWSVYNYLKWGVPFDYIPIVGTDSPQYLGRFSIWERLTDFNWPLGSNIFVSLNADLERNMWITVIKELVFDEFTIGHGKWGIFGANILFYVNVIAVLVVVLAVLYTVLHHIRQIESAIKLFLIIYFAVLLGMYFKFVFKYPYVCSMSARYIVPTIFIGIFCVGFLIQDIEKNVLCCRAIKAIGVLFCTVSIWVYIWLGVITLFV